MNNTLHWTQRSPEDFLYSIASDFIEDLKNRMRSLGMSQTKLARAARVNKSYISRIFKDPGNLSLDTIVKLARTVGMKVSIVPYVDPDDPNNERGPIGSDIFRWCWEHADRPVDAWDIREIKQRAATANAANAFELATLIVDVEFGIDIDAHRGANYTMNVQRKPHVTSGSLDTEIFDVEVKESKNTSRRDPIAA
jgi:transcriptional regulator with XRE-family HTH domain